MKGDNSRDTFRAKKHYAQVRMQQGRVQVDADWNEQGEIVTHRVETEALDTIGVSGGPLNGGGFEITAPTGTAGGDFRIGAGRYYVDGILCINETATAYTTQPDLPASAIRDNATYVAYLDVWQRHLTALDDPSIREVALGGPDTGTRVKNVWQVKVLVRDAANTCLTPLGIADPTGRMLARTKQEAISTNPCVVPPGAGYRGLENQLYRVEVHGGGTATNVSTAAAPIAVTRVANKTNQVQFTTGTWQVGQAVEIVSARQGVSSMNGTFATITAVDTGTRTLTLSINISSIDPADLRFRPADATYKWSRENGAIVSAVENINNGTEVTVHDLGPDAVLGFREGLWVEYSDDAMELTGQAGVLAQIVKLDRAVNLVTLSAPLPPLVVTNGVPDLSKHPELRIWHGVGGIKFRPGNALADDLELENGVMIRFTAGTYRTGDYWNIPARTATADAQSGNIEWPGGELLPFGIKHHYARLAMLRLVNGVFQVIADCRNLFPAITELTTLVYVGGDGQEAMPGNALPQLLQAGVFNGRWPVAGARVRFRTTPANGRLAPTIAALGASAVNTIIVTTGADGIASCAWRPDPNVATPSQQVEARMLDANSADTPSIVRFNANLSIASQVFYDPGACNAMVGKGTVQTAVDQLARLVSLYEVSGGHQDVVPGSGLEPLVVLAANRCGPVPNKRVTFRVVAGSGTVAPTDATTDANGRATAVWTADPTTQRQQVEATVVDDAPVSITAPTTVRFVANLATQKDPGIHIREVTTVVDRAPLENDTVVPVDRLSEGIIIACDEQMVGVSVGTAPEGSKFPNTVQAKPTCFVTIDLPFPLAPETNVWLTNAIVGFQPIVLQGSAILLRGNQGRDIRWAPSDATRVWLVDTLMTLLGRLEIADRVLAHLTLKGNYIWSPQKPAKFLDGNAFGEERNGRTGITFPTGDDRKGGDFEMWFWLSPQQRQVPPGPVLNAEPGPRTIRGTVRDQTGAPLPGMTVTANTVPPSPSTTRSVQTDATGAFTFIALVPGNYTVSVTFNGILATRQITVP